MVSVPADSEKRRAIKRKEGESLDTPYAIEMLHITKRFPGIIANDDITLQVKKGEIHALLGENGAGKSTLMSVLFGLYQAEEGTIRKDGVEVSIKDPNDANALGIGMVHQHFKLVECFSVLDNIIMGVEPTKHGFLQKKEARERVLALSEKYGLKVDPDALIEDITVGMQQRTEILKMLYRENEILIFDEPTAVLTPQEIDELMEIMRSLAAEGKSILFISHKLNEIMAVADRCTVLRKGRYVGTVETKDTTMEQLSAMMVGRNVNFHVEKKPSAPGDVVLDVEHMTVASKIHKNNAVKDVSLQVRRGEIVCLAGIDGNGQSELVEAIVGTLKQQQGTITMNGKDISNASVLARQEAGISHVSEDRMKFGTAPKLSLEDNAISKVYYTDKLKTHGLLDSKKISEFTNRILKEFLVKFDNSKQSIAELSGGNVQKVVVGREFDYEPDLLIMNQPTRGIDVGAIEFIRKKIVDMRSGKKAILLVSADLSEILSLSDTILVMHEGRIVGHISDVKNTSENELGLYMLGVKEDSKEQIGGAYCE